MRAPLLACLAVALWAAPALAQVEGPPPPTAVAARPRRLPFRLGLAYEHVFDHGGGLGEPSSAANVVSVDLGFAAAAGLRFHLGLGHQWERAGSYSAKGFRLDLLSLGFPIALHEGQGQIHVEPLLRIARGEILFPTGSTNEARFRIESGFGVLLTAAISDWFLGLEPLSVDFRYFAATNHETRTGFTTLWNLKVVAGRQFW